jgi:hypothetical protein
MQWLGVSPTQTTTTTIQQQIEVYPANLPSGHTSVVDQLPSTWPMVGTSRPSSANVSNINERSPTTSIPSTPQGPNVLMQKCIPVGVASIGAHSAQPHSAILSSWGCSGPLERRARHCAMDLVMKRLGIELTLEGQQVVPIMHYNVDGRPCGVGKSMWLSTFQGYALQLNLAIDDIH